MNVISSAFLGGGGGEEIVVDPTPTPAIAFSVAGTAALVQGATTTVSGSVSRTGGYTGAVTLTASGLPSGVTATPVVLGTGVTSGALTLTAASDAALGPDPFTVTATGAGVASVFDTCTVTVSASGGGVVDGPTPPAYERPELATGPNTYYVTAGAAGGGNGSSGTPWNSMAQLTAAAATVAGQTVVVSGVWAPNDVLPVANGVFSGEGVWLYTRYVTPGGGSATFYGTTYDSGQRPIHLVGKSRFILDGDFRVRATSTPGVFNGDSAGVFLSGCSNFQLVGVSVVGSYASGDTTSAMSVGGFTFFGCANGWSDGLLARYVGSTPDAPSNAGDAFFVGGIGGATDLTFVRCTAGEAGHAGFSLTGFAGQPIVLRVSVLACVFDNTWTEGLNCNGASDACTFRWNTGRNNGQLKHNAFSRGGMMICGTNHVAERNAMIGAHDFSFKLQAYDTSYLQPCTGNTFRYNTAFGGQGPSFVLLVRNDSDAPKDAQHRDNLIEKNIFWDGCQLVPTSGGNAEGDQGGGHYFGATYPFVIQLGYAATLEWNRWYTGGVFTLHGNIVRDNVWGSPHKGGSLPLDFCYVVTKTGTIPQFNYAAPSNFVAAHTASSGNTLGVDPLFVSTTSGSEDLHTQAGSPAAAMGVYGV